MPTSDNLGHKILSFFIKEESLSGRPAPAAPAPASPGTPVNNPVPAGAVDAKFAEHFANVLAKNNLPGPDYFEFREALRSLGSLILLVFAQVQATQAA